MCSKVRDYGAQRLWYVRASNSALEFRLVIKTRLCKSDIRQRTPEQTLVVYYRVENGKGISRTTPVMPIRRRSWRKLLPRVSETALEVANIAN